MAKKTASTDKSAAKPKAAAKKTASTSSSGNSGFDTNQLTNNAASLLAARAKNALPSAGSKKPESQGFKQMKESLGQPQHSSGSLVSGIGAATKTTKSTGFNQQVGHSQTVGNKSANTGVPRRTSTG